MKTQRLHHTQALQLNSTDATAQGNRKLQRPELCTAEPDWGAYCLSAGRLQEASRAEYAGRRTPERPFFPSSRLYEQIFQTNSYRNLITTQIVKIKELPPQINFESSFLHKMKMLPANY